MRPIAALFLSAFLLIISGCIVTEKPVVVSESQATGAWKADGIIGESEYSRSMNLSSPPRQGYSGGDLVISWRNDREYLYLGLDGSTDGWIAIGFEPLEWMKDADMIIATVQNGQVTALDEYCTGNYGPHLEDTVLGGKNDIEEFGGLERGARTTIELKRRLDTGDRFDKPFTPGGAVSIIWALSDDEEMQVKHNVAYGEGIMTLTEALSEGGVENESAAPLQGLSARESEGLMMIWEEEKAARDLYTALYESDNITLLKNLATSEQSHMDRARVVMEKYGMGAPMDSGPGVFSNRSIQMIHDDLLARGLSSDGDAIAVAAFFEQTSINDLERELNATGNEDLRSAYLGLLAGSRKHLRSCMAALDGMGGRYPPMQMERGMGSGMGRGRQ